MAQLAPYDAGAPQMSGAASARLIVSASVLAWLVLVGAVYSLL